MNRMNRPTRARRRLFLEPLESRRMLTPVNVEAIDPQYEKPPYGTGCNVLQINPTIAVAGSQILVAYTQDGTDTGVISTDHGVSFGPGGFGVGGFAAGNE